MFESDQVSWNLISISVYTLWEGLQYIKNKFQGWKCLDFGEYLNQNFGCSHDSLAT